mmetsp:Transcript_645/g.1328  ORF Transcript_645/g.1328 Transcript_645/m.1328 type:complete len:251 (-) Transcript_645:184-936(-)
MQVAFVKATLRQEHIGQAPMRAHLVGIRRQRGPKFALARVPVEVVPVLAKAYPGAGLRKVRRQRQRLTQRVVGGGEDVTRHPVSVPQSPSMSPGEQRPGQGIFGVDGERLVEPGHAAINVCDQAALRPPLGREIELIGVGVVRAAQLRESGTCGRRAQRRAQLLDHTLRNLILDLKHAGEGLVKAAAPCGHAVAGVQEPSRGAKAITASLQRTVNDPSDIQFSRRAQRVLVQAGVTPHGADGSHGEPGDA